MVRDVPLGDLIEPSKVRRAGSGNYPILSMTMHEGLVDQSAKFKKRVASDDLSDYKVVTRGQLVVGFPIDEGVLDFQTLYDSGIVSPAYGVWDLTDASRVHIQYLKRFLRSTRALTYYKAKLRGSTARRRSLPVELFLALPVPLPAVEEQQRVAGLLDQADAIRVKRCQVLAHFDSLAQSIFHDMFGESGNICKVQLADIADIISGITIGRRTSESTRPVPYLAVSNVQSGHLKLDLVKEIEATETEISRYTLREGDLVLTEGGDPDKLGRGTVWRNEFPLCLHQNHIFRVRINTPDVISDYLEYYTASRAARSYFLRSAKQTTGIASINKTQLKALPVVLPPLEMQLEFADRAARVDAQRQLVQRALDADNELFASLQARAFRGEL